MSVLRLALDTHDPVQRARARGDVLGRRIGPPRGPARRARSGRAYWAAPHERARDPAAVRERLGLSRGARARRVRHLDAAPHLRRYVTKALAMHLADSVWTRDRAPPVSRRERKRHGMPHVGRWYDFTRLPGRARSHTKAEQVGDVPAARHARRPSRRVHRRRRRLRPAAPHAPRPSQSTRGGATPGRSRSCSRACPAARSSCRCGCRPRRRTSRSSITTSRIRAAGTRSIWSAGAIRTPPAAGATRRT